MYPIFYLLKGDYKPFGFCPPSMRDYFKGGGGVEFMVSSFEQHFKHRNWSFGKETG